MRKTPPAARRQTVIASDLPADLASHEKNEILSQAAHIRRGDEVPGYIRTAMESTETWPTTFIPQGLKGSLTLNYRRSGWRSPFEWKIPVHLRKTKCLVRDGQERVGYMAFCEYKADPMLPPEDFLDAMDSLSSEAFDFADMLCSCWEDVGFDLFEAGPVLEFRTAWMAPKHSHGGWAEAARQLIASRFSAHSILVMKAFPLEYVARAPERSPAHEGLASRQKAMIRYYRRLFDVTPLAGDYAEWLWRANPRHAELIAPPQ